MCTECSPLLRFYSYHLRRKKKNLTPLTHTSTHTHSTKHGDTHKNTLTEKTDAHCKAHQCPHAYTHHPPLPGITDNSPFLTEWVQSLHFLCSPFFPIPRETIMTLGYYLSTVVIRCLSALPGTRPGLSRGPWPFLSPHN